MSSNYGFTEGMLVGISKSQAAKRRGDIGKVFDWDTAARRIIETRAIEARAGLGTDWAYTGGTIWEDGKPNTTSYTYLASAWAIPELDIDGHIEPCWIDEIEAKSRGWDSSTKWPESALTIIREARR